jgi:predicted regulator of Ras-like GTPase activity (Roadblock/LC7/MglB family)
LTDSVDALAARLVPYRQTPGIIAALLISSDGFVVAADAEPGFSADAVAALASGVIGIGSKLAGELRQGAAKYIAIEFDDLTMVLAPFGDQLMLVLVGLPTTLICDYRLSTTVA